MQLVAVVAMAPAMAIAPGPHQAPEGSLRFEKTFSDAAEPPSIHYRVNYQSRGAPHRLEVWREGQVRLRRRTDDAIDTFVVREPGSPEYRMSVLDLRRKIVTRIDRTNLYRVGNFTDWFDLAHGLRHPKGDYRLTAGVPPTTTARPVAPCTWYDLTQAGRPLHVCWSERVRLPLLLVDEHGEVRWRVTSIDRTPIPAGTFTIHDTDFVRNDANQDIDRD